MGILSATAFSVQSTYHINKDKSPVQLVFVRDMIIPIKHIADWIYINQCKQVQMEKYIIHEKSTWIKYNHRFLGQVLLINKSAYKYETTFIGMYEKFQTRKNKTVALGVGAVKKRINIRCIKPYKKE